MSKTIYDCIKEMTKEEMAEVFIDMGFKNDFRDSISKVKCNEEACEYYNECDDSDDSEPCKFTDEEIVLAFLEFDGNAT